MIYLRKADATDVDLLFEWANEPEVRKNSFNSELIDYSVHTKWFNKVLSSDNIEQFILMDDDTAVGQIRININEDEAEISYSIGAEFRGKGYGKRIVKELEEQIKTSYPKIQKLIARVKPSNIASKRVFESEDYELKSLKYEHFVNRGGYRVVFDLCFSGISSQVAA